MSAFSHEAIDETNAFLIVLTTLMDGAAGQAGLSEYQCRALGVLAMGARDRFADQHELLSRVSVIKMLEQVL